MVSFVIVSHSAKLADGVIDLAEMSAPGAQLYPAGGLEDGSHGTSFDLISHAIESAWSEDGVIVLMDMGSSVMTTELVLESIELERVVMVDCPIVSGAVSGAALAVAGAELDEIVEELKAL